MQTKDFFHNLDEPRLVKAIEEGEKRTSAEIRVYVSEAEVTDPTKAAEEMFLKMGMAKTALRNGVLIFIAPRSQKFSVVGDVGIHEKCGENFWQHIVEVITPEFKAGRFTEGLVAAVHLVSEKLAQYFPRSGDDQNELPDKVLRGG